ncbi:hypothetical protein B0H13DRAFT_2341846 [Mycena leptocephala]|nr:hypothetical protein B0H13DRAFT_2341846 [Mycena leptocephala]
MSLSSEKGLSASTSLTPESSVSPFKLPAPPSTPSSTPSKPQARVSAIPLPSALKTALPNNLGEASFLDTVRDSRNILIDVSVLDIPQSAMIFLRLYFPDTECGLVGGLAAFWG